MQSLSKDFKDESGVLNIIKEFVLTDEGSKLSPLWLDRCLGFKLLLALLLLIFLGLSDLIFFLLVLLLSLLSLFHVFSNKGFSYCLK